MDKDDPFVYKKLDSRSSSLGRFAPSSVIESQQQNAEFSTSRSESGLNNQERSESQSHFHFKLEDSVMKSAQLFKKVVPESETEHIVENPQASVSHQAEQIIENRGHSRPKGVKKKTKTLKTPIKRERLDWSAFECCTVSPPSVIQRPVIHGKGKGKGKECRDAAVSLPSSSSTRSAEVEPQKAASLTSTKVEPQKAVSLTSTKVEPQKAASLTFLTKSSEELQKAASLTSATKSYEVGPQEAEEGNMKQILLDKLAGVQVLVGEFEKLSVELCGKQSDDAGMKSTLRAVENLNNTVDGYITDVLKESDNGNLEGLLNEVTELKRMVDGYLFDVKKSIQKAEKKQKKDKKKRV